MKEVGLTITVDPDEPIIRVKLSGFWNVELVNVYEKDRHDALMKLRGRHYRPEEIGVILDATDFEIQSREVADRLGQMASGVEFSAIHVAVVIGSALRRIQAERIAPHRYHYFSTMADAEVWLRSLSGIA